MKLQYRKNDMTGEELYYGTHPSGLGIYIIPDESFSSAYAVIATAYGSIDSSFIVPGEVDITTVPDGIAHYLEHKMFDQPDGTNAFDKFSEYGGNANAYTSQTRTGYIFSATSNFKENLVALLDYVQTPHFTAESVEKERGIIEQEIKMYDDSPQSVLLRNFLKCLYKNHPVNKDIAGTVESISKITPEYLYKCYETFYNLSNMIIVVAGNVEPENVADIIDKNIKKNEPFKEEIKRIMPDEPDEVASHYVEEKMAVQTPMFVIGFKDIDTKLKGDELLKKNIEINIIMKMLFGKSSAFHKKMYNKGFLNGELNMGVDMNTDYAFSLIIGSGSKYKKIYSEIANEIKKAHKNGLSVDDFERTKKVLWGEYIQGLVSPDDNAETFCELKLMGVDYFNYSDIYNSVTFEDIQKRFENHFVSERSAMSVVKPL